MELIMRKAYAPEASWFGLIAWVEITRANISMIKKLLLSNGIGVKDLLYI
jgi:hypothetical protein